MHGQSVRNPLKVSLISGQDFENQISLSGNTISSVYTSQANRQPYHRAFVSGETSPQLSDSRLFEAPFPKDSSLFFCQISFLANFFLKVTQIYESHILFGQVYGSREKDS
jgi:hypothetical protein